MSKNTKVVIEVSGGAVQEVYASWAATHIDVILVDRDDLEAEGKTSDEIDAILAKEVNEDAADGLVPVGFERPEGTGL